MKRLNNITADSLFESYFEFKKGKRKSKELLDFEKNREDNLFLLYEKLSNETFVPGKYQGFHINDPKPRLIHKAPLADRIVHHWLGKTLESQFDPIFIAYSFACRKNKGTHAGVQMLLKIARQVSKNDQRICYALKCDINKFFASVDQKILLELVCQRLTNPFIKRLVKLIVGSFSTKNKPGNGLPIGNLTSQYFANIYMHEFDFFVKHQLRIKYYLRYTDDFVILSNNQAYLQSMMAPIEEFLKQRLKLTLHPKKIVWTTFRHGIDFLGYVVYPQYILPRKKTERRLWRKIEEKIVLYKRGRVPEKKLYETVQSYLGYLSHCNSYQLQCQIISHVNKVCPDFPFKFKLISKKHKTKKIPGVQNPAPRDPEW